MKDDIKYEIELKFFSLIFTIKIYSYLVYFAIKILIF